ncbi:restriction endonuclease [Roseateles sp. DAIF2]|nr:restriction endonuclease [Roseateles sp. DAIF2]
MAKNSLFAILLRSSWWISLLIGLLLGLLSFALLPEHLRVVGALSGFPFIVISLIAARRQWHLPSAARIEQTQQALATMAWPAFAALLEQAFRRDGYTLVPQGKGGADAAFDFELERQGRRMLVSARRWKSARTGLEALRALQGAREVRQADEALYIGLAALSDNARPYAAEQRITLWQAPELAHALRGLPLPATERR